MTTVDGKVPSIDELNDLTQSKSQVALLRANMIIQNYNYGKSLDEAIADGIKKYSGRSDIATLKDMGFGPDRLESYVRTYIAKNSDKAAREARRLS